MSELIVNTNNLQDEGLDAESVDLGTSDMTTATTDLGSSNLQVGIGGTLMYNAHTSGAFVVGDDK